MYKSINTFFPSPSRRSPQDGILRQKCRGNRAGMVSALGGRARLSAKHRFSRGENRVRFLRKMTTEGDRPAFTLIELIVSISLLALVGFGVVTLFPRGLQLVARSQSTTIAANLAQAEIETILAQSYATVSTGTYEARHTVTGHFDRSATVGYVDPATLGTSSSDQGLKRVTVTVYYPSSYGEKTFVLGTIIARK